HRPSGAMGPSTPPDATTGAKRTRAARDSSPPDTSPSPPGASVTPFSSDPDPRCVKSTRRRRFFLASAILCVHNASRLASGVLGGPSPPTLAQGAPMTTSGTDLCRLIERARREEPGALDRLLDSYRNYLRLLARTGLDASLQGKADPSDLVQDALLKASLRFGQFRGANDAELAGCLRQIPA